VRERGDHPQDSARPGDAMPTTSQEQAA